MELLRHAVSGEGPAAFTIGKIHLGGMYGAPVDYKIAIKWFEKAYALEIYESVEIAEELMPGLKQSILSGQTKVSKADMHRLARAAYNDRAQTLQDILHPERRWNRRLTLTV